MGISVTEKRPFLEMVFLVVLMLISALFFPQFKALFGILPIVYYFVERKIRGRSRENNGFNFANLLHDIKKSWVWVLLVGIVFQILYVIIYKNYFPEIFAHVLARAPVIKTFDVKLVITLFILALGEEITFRGLVQERLQWVMKPHYAIVLTSIIFALMHISPGEPKLVALDLTTIFIDSVIFGIIFYKTKRIYASWIAHALANIAATYMITNL
ncbi:CAAX amino terminal protease family protein [Bacillus methanolicus PB1]|uniref:CAAX amino terminal protease family protein n=1 Tax=Bacillus methanolicus PB1 TaxID=997296 RepID=I3E118_BACMT|nr:type II CAAX endopeptidase family protein [Bacillus methanolicus]EIJ80189.1 CAAX amino terminal protease family protein [Bacillus methanolicus PB1]